MNDINPAFVMPDVQSSVDTRQIVIQRVGVKGVRYPLTLKTPTGEVGTVGTFNMDVRLPADQKGTHMSRFVALLEDNRAPLDLAAFRALLDDMLVRL
ncbi:MAG: GTP cyclohydrolase I FolE2, partial [Dyella sp.]|nr:GTP cyclohydrolase I FolE2 [Dyella sp.]